MRLLPIALLFCAVAGARCIRAETVCPQFFPVGKAPDRGVLFCNAGYAIGYSPTHKTALWAAEQLTDDSVTKAQTLHGRAAFFPDYRLFEAQRTDRADYRDGSYARGHLAPSGDQPNWPARTQTYLYSNVVPQDSSMNSGPWNQIEQDVRQAALDDGELYVVTGPIFPRVPDRTGPDRVAVPTALFKMVYDQLDGGVAALICQNDTPARCRQVTPTYLTATLGFDPMPGLSLREKAVPLTVRGWAKVIKRSQY